MAYKLPYNHGFTEDVRAESGAKQAIILCSLLFVLQNKKIIVRNTILGSMSFESLSLSLRALIRQKQITRCPWE